MKILIFSSIGFDALLSAIKSLRGKSDIYYLFELRTEKPNIAGIRYELKEDVVCGTELPELCQFAQYLPLEKTYAVNSCKYTKIYKIIRKQIAVYKRVKTINPDVIHCYNELPPVFYLAMLLNRKKMILTVHDPIQHSSENSNGKKILRVIAFSLIKKYILLNNAQKQTFKEVYKIKEEDIYLSQLGVYEYLNDYIKNDKICKNDDFNILFFGRISKYKGIEYLIKAFILMQSENVENITLTVAGNGQFSFNITQYKNNPNIQIISRYISPRELAILIYNSSVVVCPYTDATQSGVIMSSFALRKPVIATDVGGLKEFVEHRKTGLIVPPRDIDALKEAMMTLYLNQNLLQAMSINIKNRYFEGDMNWNTITDNLLSIYQDIVN